MSTTSESRVETYIDPDDKQKGRIQYRFKHTEPLKGLFSSTYYLGATSKDKTIPGQNLTFIRRGFSSI
jgi:hypothetical protein